MSDLPASEHESILVIGYGNTLRSDDAVGRRVAEAVAGWNLPHVRAISVHQLTPELAQDISQSSRVLFVDACVGKEGESVSVRCIEASGSVAAMEHSTNPRALLAYSQALFGVRPVAFWINVPGINFELGEQLSSHAESGMAIALQMIERRLLGDSMPPTTSPLGLSQRNGGLTTTRLAYDRVLPCLFPLFHHTAQGRVMEKRKEAEGSG